MQIIKPTKNEVAGMRLRKIREERHLTLQQVSESTGISVSALSLYENGKRIIPNVSLYRLTEFFCINREAILGKPEIK